MTAAVRLVASDLDGTLLGVDNVVSERTRRAIAALVAQGVHVVAATGRSQWTAAPLVAPVVGVELVVCSNGASLYHVRREESLASYPIADAVIDAILGILPFELPGCCFGWETEDDLHYDREFVAFRPEVEREPSPELTPAPRPRPIRKLLIGHPEIRHHALLDRILPLLPLSCLGSTSGASFVEVTGDGIDKAFGVQQVCADLGIAPEEVVAFGDNHNDVPLLRWAGRGIAMANAHASVRDVVDETTASHQDDGVAAVLETLI